MPRGVVFQELQPGAGFETGDFLKRKVGEATVERLCAGKQLLPSSPPPRPPPPTSKAKKHVQLPSRSSKNAHKTTKCHCSPKGCWPPRFPVRYLCMRRRVAFFDVDRTATKSRSIIQNVGLHSRPFPVRTNRTSFFL